MPKPYVPRMPNTWWLHQAAYFKFMLREFTAVFIAIYCVILLIGISRLKAGAEEYSGFVAALQTPWSIGFHTVALAFAIYHSVTAWNAIPKLLVVRLGEEQVPPALLVLSQYGAWLAVSALLVWLVFGY